MFYDLFIIYLQFCICFLIYSLYGYARDTYRKRKAKRVDMPKVKEHMAFQLLTHRKKNHMETAKRKTVAFGPLRATLVKSDDQFQFNEMQYWSLVLVGKSGLVLEIAKDETHSTVETNYTDITFINVIENDTEIFLRDAVYARWTLCFNKIERQEFLASLPTLIRPDDDEDSPW